MKCIRNYESTTQLLFDVFRIMLVVLTPYRNIHYETRLFQYIENFTTNKENFQIKKSDVFHILAQNIDCGYSLEPPPPQSRGDSNEYPQSMF